MSPSGLDQAWSVTPPKTAKAAGVQVVSMYCSYDSSKDVTAGKVRAYWAVGIATLLNWEAQPGAPLNGAGQGRSDATEAVRQANALLRQLGYAPKNRPVLYFSCDTDANPSRVEAYYRAAQGVCHAGGFGVGVYGSARVVADLAKKGITDAEWQTYAWSNGVLAPAADFYQYSNSHSLGGASVDYDRVIHPASLGALWPPTSSNNTAAPAANLGGLTVSEATDILKRIDALQAHVDSLFTPYKGKAPHALQTHLRHFLTGAPYGEHDADTAIVPRNVAGDAYAANTAMTAAGGVLARVAALQKTVAGGAFDPAAAAAAIKTKLIETLGGHQ